MFLYITIYQGGTYNNVLTTLRYTKEEHIIMFLYITVYQGGTYNNVLTTLR